MMMRCPTVRRTLDCAPLSSWQPQGSLRRSSVRARVPVAGGLPFQRARAPTAGAPPSATPLSLCSAWVGAPVPPLSCAHAARSCRAVDRKPIFESLFDH